MYIIRNKITKDYVGKLYYIATNNLNRARTFSQINHCGSFFTHNGINKNEYEILEVEIKQRMANKDALAHEVVQLVDTLNTLDEKRKTISNGETDKTDKEIQDFWSKK